MNILVALLVTWANAGIRVPPACERSFLRSQLTPGVIDMLPNHFVTLITGTAESRGLMIAAARSRSNDYYFRLLDQRTNEVREINFRSGVPNIKRVLVHREAAEIIAARQRAGPAAESAFFEPHASNSAKIRTWLNLKMPVHLVLARDDTFGLETLDGFLTPYPTEEVPTELSIKTSGGLRRFDSRRLVAAFGTWQGF